MHICCANCSINPVTKMTAEGHEVTGLWFNPNIHPEDEYQKRRQAVRELQQAKGINIIYEGAYGLDEFNEALKDTPLTRPERCAVCYRMRMLQTARKCAEGGYDAFTTSLLISPYQAHDVLIEEAEAAADKFNVKFHYEDFRTIWREGQTLAREQGFYRQYYCGCIYSRNERDEERARAKREKREKSARRRVS